MAGSLVAVLLAKKPKRPQKWPGVPLGASEARGGKNLQIKSCKGSKSYFVSKF